MKEPTLTLRLLAFFTYKSRFPAFPIDTDIFSTISIWTIGLLFQYAGHIKLRIKNLIYKKSRNRSTNNHNEVELKLLNFHILFQNQ